MSDSVITDATGIYERLEARSGIAKNNRPWTAYNAIISGQKIGLGFDNKLVNGFADGTPVKYSASKDARGYWKLDRIEALPEGTEVPTSGGVDAGNPAAQARTTFTISQEHTLRQQAFREARETVLTNFNVAVQLGKLKTVPSTAVLLKRIVGMADEIVGYIRTGKLDSVNATTEKAVKEAVAPGGEASELPAEGAKEPKEADDGIPF